MPFSISTLSLGNIKNSGSAQKYAVSQIHDVFKCFCTLARVPLGSLIYSSPLLGSIISHITAPVGMSVFISLKYVYMSGLSIMSE